MVSNTEKADIENFLKEKGCYKEIIEDGSVKWTNPNDWVPTHGGPTKR